MLVRFKANHFSRKPIAFLQSTNTFITKKIKIKSLKIFKLFILLDNMHIKRSCC